MMKLRLSRIMLLSLIFVAAVAAFLRLYGLAFWELTVDEYYLAKSIISVSENGLPSFPDGGYYIRGLLQQYLTAPIYLVTDNIEFSIRIIPAVSNIITLPAVYLIGSKIANNKAGLLAAIIFALSLWEIEFARFGRMYAPFQAIFLWQVYYMLRYHALGNPRDLFAVSFLSFVSVFVYEGAIFSILTSFFSLTLRAITWEKVSAAIPGLLALGLAVFKQGLELRNTENTTQPTMPSTNEPSLPINVPDFLYHSGNFSILHLTLIFFGVILTFFLLYKNRHQIQSSNIKILYICLVVAQISFALINQLLLVLILAGTLILIPTPCARTRKLKKIFNELPIKLAIIWSCIWIIIFLSLPDVRFKEFLDSVTSFPQLKERIYWPLQSAIPITVTWLFGASIFLSIYVIKHQNSTSGANIVLILAALVLVSISSLDTLYSISRYSFFIYPLFLIFFSSAAILIANYFQSRFIKAIFAASILSIFFVSSEDYNLNHLLNVASAEYNYRIPYSMNLQQHYYVRFDYKTPAEFVNNNRRNGDRTLTSVEVVDHYLTAVDYTYVPTELRPGLIACGGNCYIWNKTPLISDSEEVIKLINEAERDLWIIIHMSRNIYRDQIDSYIDENFPENKVYVNFDKSIAVYKF